MCSTPRRTFEAASCLPDGRSVVKGLANDSARDYAARIAPLWERVYRPIYGKGSALLEQARDAVNAGDIGYAVTLWTEAARSASIDESGRALYNLAVAAEQRGDLAGALDLATRADAKLRLRGPPSTCSSSGTSPRVSPHAE